MTNRPFHPAMRSARRSGVLVLAIACFLFSSSFAAPQDAPTNTRPNSEFQQSASPGLRLEDLEQMALQNNPTMSQAQAQVRAAAGRTRQAGLYPNPTIGYQGDEIRGGSFQGGEQGFFVSQDIVLGGKLAAARKTAQQQGAEATAALEEQRYRVLSTVRILFYQALGAQQMVVLRGQMNQLANDAAQTSRQLANVGQADEPDVLQAEAEAGLAALEVANAEQDQMRIWRELAAAVGKPGLPISPLAGNLEDIPQMDAGQMLLTVLRDSPAVKRAQAELARSEAALNLAHKVPIPDLQLSAGLQQDRELMELTRRTTGLIGFVQAGVQIPLFNRNQGNVAANQADVERSRLEVTRVQLQIRRRFAPVMQQYVMSRAAVERYKTDILPKAQKAYDLYRRKYGVMQAAYPQVLISQRTLFQFETDYVHALEKLWLSSVAINGFLLSDGMESPMSQSSEDAITGSTITLPMFGR